MVNKKQDGKINRVVQTSFPQFEDVESPNSSLSKMRQREAQLRSAADIYIDADSQSATNFPPLILPFRWEGLQKEARLRKVPLKPLITPVEYSIASVQRELRQIQETSMGRIFIISGPTGTGKTTFLNSLRYFLDEIGIYDAKLMSLDGRQSVEGFLASLRREKNRHSIVVLEGREAPGSLKTEELDVLLTSLNTDFRRDSGCRTLFVIPTTSQAVAKAISERATSIGGMISSAKPFHVFEGPPRSQYFSVTNATVKALNESRTLREYGVSEAVAKGIAQATDSIGSFIEGCYNEIVNHREALIHAAGIHAAGVISRKRKRVRLWMVFAALEKNTRRNNDIMRSLTFGDQQHVQVERILAGDSEEARFWQDQQGAFGLAAQYLDLRIMYLPVRTANAVVTAYGSKEFIHHLKSLAINGKQVMKRQVVRASAQDSLRSTAIGAFLKGEGFVEHDPTKRSVTEEHLAVFMEIVKKASKDDKSINATLADALREWYKDGEAEIITELPLNDSGTLTCDIGIVTPTDIYCLEMKWRSSELYDSEVIRTTTSRVRDYARELPELRAQLKDPDK